MVPPASRPITRVGRYSGTPLRQVHGLRLPGFHRLWQDVPVALQLTSPDAYVGPTTPRPQGPRFGLCPVRSPLLRASRLISLSTRYLDVSVPWVRSPFGVTAGFPHSGILGSMRVCRSPRLIAAYRALHRLRVPRHPRLAFARLTTICDPAEHARSTTSDQISVELLAELNVEISCH